MNVAAIMTLCKKRGERYYLVIPSSQGRRYWLRIGSKFALMPIYQDITVEFTRQILIQAAIIFREVFTF